MAPFRSKKLDLSCYVNIRNIRDHTKRKVYEKFESERQALRYIIRNTTLPQRARACIDAGKGRGVLVSTTLDLSIIKMFRLKSSSLPPDPEFPADLEKLGYQINEKDQIRSIKKPDQEFHYFISKNERVLEKQREAMDICIRNNLLPRFHASGLHTTRLPLTTGPLDPHIPILTTPNLSNAKRVILYIGENNQDLGILAYRIIGREGLAKGSVLDFAAAAKDTGNRIGGRGDGDIWDNNDTALVFANLGQLIWHRRGQKALSIRSWDALPRKTGVGAPLRLDAKENRVVGHENQTAHVASVFEFLKGAMAEGAKVDVVGLAEGAEEVLRYLDKAWEGWKGKLGAMVTGMGYNFPLDLEVGDQGFKEWIGMRARTYIIHPDPVGIPLSGRSLTGCNVFSSGESQYTECIIPKAHAAMLDFLKMAHEVPGYEEPMMRVNSDEDGGDRPLVSWVGGGQDGGPNITLSVRPLVDTQPVSGVVGEIEGETEGGVEGNGDEIVE
ncbi:uncharacterized protein KY384_001119 [Bacidia gigantensis]|uniref:uncharacterized protein n=1 Tax=Bacidia gigantensis TaxID=2732470 RepID=UPI001D05A9A4|nr:uncharacterized protein KY384_001119 [Bacidia gigantensis]KAG8534275.1 hypothetical protein KY384_001119 [Bacidia gigantensis]